MVFPALLACTDSHAPCDEPGAVVAFPAEVPSVQQSGESVTLAVTATDGCGNDFAPEALDWSSVNPVVATVDGTGTVTGHTAGQTPIVAKLGEAASATVRVFVRQHSAGAAFRERGLGLAESVAGTADLWLHGDLGLTGSRTWETSCAGEECVGPVVLWDLTNPASPRLMDTVSIGGGANDVKISADGRVAVAGVDGASDGIAVFDLSRPLAPELVATYADGLGRIHNAYLERVDGTLYAFLADTRRNVPGGVHVLDLSDPAAPAPVSHFYGGSSYVHDVYVRDGLAFVSHWDAGLIILDVGNGIAGGSPATPVEVGRVEIPGGFTHNAWYWPDRGYVFVGQESADGIVFVVDASNPAAPTIVGEYTVGEIAPHNFWLDEDKGVLFIAYYTHGIRALDVSGTLSGDLMAQGRELAAIAPAGPNGNSSFWGVQLHRGLLYGADQNHGLWVFEFERAR